MDTNYSGRPRSASGGAVADSHGVATAAQFYSHGSARIRHVMPKDNSVLQKMESSTKPMAHILRSPSAWSQRNVFGRVRRIHLKAMSGIAIIVILFWTGLITLMQKDDYSRLRILIGADPSTTLLSLAVGIDDTAPLGEIELALQRVATLVPEVHPVVFTRSQQIKNLANSLQLDVASDTVVGLTSPLNLVWSGNTLNTVAALHHTCFEVAPVDSAIFCGFIHAGIMATDGWIPTLQAAMYDQRGESTQTDVLMFSKSADVDAAYIKQFVRSHNLGVEKRVSSRNLQSDQYSLKSPVSLVFMTVASFQHILQLVTVRNVPQIPTASGIILSAVIASQTFNRRIKLIELSQTLGSVQLMHVKRDVKTPSSNFRSSLIRIQNALSSTQILRLVAKSSDSLPQITFHTPKSWKFDPSMFFDIDPVLLTSLQSSSMNSVSLPMKKKEPTIVLFSTFISRPVHNVVGLQKFLIQVNTLLAMYALRSKVVFVVFTKDAMVAEMCKQFLWPKHGNVIVSDAYRENAHGTPFLSSMWKWVEDFFPKAKWTGFVNGDIVLTSELLDTLDSVEWAIHKKQKQPRSLVIGRRTNVDMPLPFTPCDPFFFGKSEAKCQTPAFRPTNHTKQLDPRNFKLNPKSNTEIAETVKKLKNKGAIFTDVAIDYFIVSKGTWRWDVIPPFIIGRIGYDNWLVDHAIRDGIRVIDATPTVCALHQTGYDGNKAGHASKPDKDWNMLLKHEYGGGFDYGSISCASNQTQRSTNGKVRIIPNRSCTQVSKSFDSFTLSKPIVPI